MLHNFFYPAPDISQNSTVQHTTVPDHSVLYDKVLGCWLGKSIGGTLGAPVEGQMKLLDVRDYPPLEGQSLPNDDLDLQLLWLSVLERHGLATDAHVLAKAWLDHVRFPYGEYGYALRNLRRGLLPPLTGSFDNPFIDGMGSPIRTEIWATVAMGKPHLAAALAFEDATVDHAGEGVWGSLFFAGLEAAAFTTSDPDTLLDLALTLIPAESKVAQAVLSVRADHRAGLSWTQTREHILEQFGNFDDFTYAPQNISFAIIGWLYGEDYGDAVLKTVNCGFDTDSSGAMVGALLGILHGASHLPERWTRPLGERVVVSPEVGGFDIPPTLEALTCRSLDVARLLELQLQAQTPLTRAVSERATPEGIRSLWQISNHTVTWRASHVQATGSGLEVNVNYPNSPAVVPGEKLNLRVVINNLSTWDWSGEVKLHPPKQWLAESSEFINLAAGSSLELAMTLLPEVQQTTPSSHEPFIAQLELSQIINGIVWQRSTYPVAVLQLHAWHVRHTALAAQTFWLEGGRLEFPKMSAPGHLVAQTSIEMPQARPVRVVVMAKTPVVVNLNGKYLYTAEGRAPMLTSPHITRDAGYEGCHVDMTLEAGTHRLELSYPALLPDGNPNEPDFRIASMQWPFYHHFVDVLGL
jgi:ADP-ribosylglycohydrolase